MIKQTLPWEELASEPLLTSYSGARSATDRDRERINGEPECSRTPTILGGNV